MIDNAWLATFNRPPAQAWRDLDADTIIQETERALTAARWWLWMWWALKVS